MQGGVLPIIGPTEDADAHSMPPRLHICCHSPQQNQMRCLFPTGNGAMLTVLNREVGREEKQHCGLPTAHLWDILLEGNAVFVLPTQKLYGFSLEVAKAICGRWGVVHLTVVPFKKMPAMLPGSSH